MQCYRCLYYLWLNTTILNSKSLEKIINSINQLFRYTIFQRTMQMNRRNILLGYPVDRKTHLANFTFGSDGSNADTLTRADFPWGYFDGRGVHWTLSDALGSVEMVVDGKGNVEQHTGYYPYGEPAGQPRLFGGKERRRFASLGDYDFHARYLTSAIALWQAPDSHAGDYEWLSPYVFCAANPIRNTDPTGMDIYEMGSWGNVIRCIKSEDYDSIRLILNNGTEVESNHLPKGAIQKQWQDETNTKNDYFEVIGDENSEYLFKFLADNTDVEFTHVQTGDEGDDAVNYISTSHMSREDRSGGNIMTGLLKRDIDFGNGIVIEKTGNVRNHTHNHKVSIYPSIFDFEMIKNFSEYPKINYSVYHKNAGYKTYHTSRGREIINLK